jgi:hypothetical protein
MRRRTFRLIGLPAALAAAAAVGCASVPAPKEELAATDVAISQAERDGAGERAPLALQNARQKLDAARAAMHDGDNEKAKRLADEALADAQLAQAQALSVQAQETAAQVRRDIDALRAEAAASARATER